MSSSENDSESTSERPSESERIESESIEEIFDEEVPLAVNSDDAYDDDELAEIPEEETPLAESPYDEESEEIVEIIDEDVPLADVPKTGDTSSLWNLGALLSACGLSVLGLKRKKDRPATEGSGNSNDSGKHGRR